MGTELLAAATYYPQADGQSERTNQRIEIALIFGIAQHPDKSSLDLVQASHNSLSNASTETSPNELKYGFKTNTDPLNVLRELDREEYDLTRDEYREVEPANTCLCNLQFVYEKAHLTKPHVLSVCSRKMQE